MFEDRYQAGTELAEHLKQLEIVSPYILALPRGGVPVGYKVAEELHAPLDVIVARKVGSPRNPEYAVGAVAESGVVILNERLLHDLGISRDDLQPSIQREQDEVKKRVWFYREGKPLPSLSDSEVVLVDDGLATGQTMLAAVTAIKKYSPRKIIAAIPVCAKESAEKLQKHVDCVVCLSLPVDLEAVGYYYHHFEQVSDEVTLALLQQAQKEYHRPDIFGFS